MKFNASQSLSPSSHHHTSPSSSAYGRTSPSPTRSQNGYFSSPSSSASGPGPYESQWKHERYRDSKGIPSFLESFNCATIEKKVVSNIDEATTSDNGRAPSHEAETGNHLSLVGQEETEEAEVKAELERDVDEEVNEIKKEPEDVQLHRVERKHRRSLDSDVHVAAGDGEDKPAEKKPKRSKEIEIRMSKGVHSIRIVVELSDDEV